MRTKCWKGACESGRKLREEWLIEFAWQRGALNASGDVATILTVLN